MAGYESWPHCTGRGKHGQYGLSRTAAVDLPLRCYRNKQQTKSRNIVCPEALVRYVWVRKQMHSGRSAQTSFSRVAQEAVGLMPVSRIMHGTGIGDRLRQDMR